MNPPSMAITGSLAALLIALPLADAADDHVAGEALVTFKQGAATDSITITLNKHSIELAEYYDKISLHGQRVIGLVRQNRLSTADLIETLQADPNVECVEPNYIRRVFAIVPNDTEFPKLWGLQNTGQTVNSIPGTSGVDTQFISAWRLSKPVSGEVVVGVVDTGTDITHPDLTSNLWKNPGEIAGNGIDDEGNGYIDDVNGYNFTNNTGSVTDSGFHGTHVAGTVAAVGKNNTGVIGLDYRAKVLPLKVSSDGNSMANSTIIAAYNYAITLKQSGVNIVALNASFGGSSFSTTDLTAISALRGAGIILCAAAGNSTRNTDTLPYYPASYTSSNIMAVAALNQTNSLASFSNYGASSVDLAAPGVNIYSTQPLDLVTSRLSSVTAGTASYNTQALVYSGTTPAGGLTGTIHACGIGNITEFPAGVRGNIALMQRGTLGFSVKVTNAMNAGAVAAVIYDNSTNPLGAESWTLGTTGNWIPSLQITQVDGISILTGLPASGRVLNTADPARAYQFLDGTSMATPHVAGAVAFAALNFPTESISQRISRILGHVTPVAALAGKMTTGGRLNLLGIVDTDGDGLPDWWETSHFGNLAEVGGGDPDRDGFSNVDEFFSGTLPTQSSSYLAFASYAPGSGSTASNFLLSFPSVEDTSYQIQWSNDLSSWSILGSTIIGTGSLVNVVDTDALNSTSKRFYRLRLIPD